jgi:hypothetical protein
VEFGVKSHSICVRSQAAQQVFRRFLKLVAELPWQIPVTITWISSQTSIHTDDIVVYFISKSSIVSHETEKLLGRTFHPTRDAPFLLCMSLTQVQQILKWRRVYSALNIRYQP